MGQLDDRYEGESFLQVNLRLDTYEPLQQSAVAPFDRQRQLLVQHLRRHNRIYAFTVEVEQIAEAYIMHLFVAIWNERVQLAAQQLPPSNADHLAEACTHLLDDQFETISIK